MAGICAVAAQPDASPTPLPSPSPAISATPTSTLTSAPAATATPTMPPIGIEPASASVPVGAPATVVVTSALSPLTITVRDPNIADAGVDQVTQRITIQGKAPGTTVITLRDARGVTRDIPVRVAYYAGAIAPHVDAADHRRPGIGRVPARAGRARRSRRRATATRCSDYRQLRRRAVSRLAAPG